MKRTKDKYIVVGYFGPLRLGADGILWAGGKTAVVFGDIDSAKSAIRKSKLYAGRHGFTGEAWKTHQIVRLVEATHD